MGYESFIAFKHLTRRRKTGFISLISFISVAGVAVGVMALIVVLAVMSGFDRELKAKFVNVQPHIRIEKVDGIDNLARDLEVIKNAVPSGIKSVAGFVEGQAIIRSYDSATGVVVKGIDAENEDLSIYEDHLLSGDLNFRPYTYHVEKVESKRRFGLFKRRTKSTVEEKVLPGVVIGRGLANRLHVRVGEEVHLISPFRDENKIFSLGSAEVQSFVVRGIFQVGMNEFDSTLALINLPDAQKLYHLENKVTGISMRFLDVDVATVWKEQLRLEFTKDYYIRSWYDLNANYFQALKVEKSVMTILLALIILVATFNIVSTLTMVVMEKTKDVGILRAIGATQASIRRIFVIQGFSTGAFGVVIGTVTGLWLASHLNDVSDFIKKTTGFEVFPSDIYYFDKIPSEIYPQDVVLTVVFAMIASIIAGFYPAYRASKLNPVEALRYE